jgi:CheY-like chemotaxis protein
MTPSEFDVFVVDDEPVIIQAAQRILESEGFALDVAEDAETALNRVAVNSYKLILCDLMLPGVRGFELVEQMQQRLPGTPVVMITGYATLENAVNGFKHGVFDFIPKPFDVDELLGVVRRGIDFAHVSGSDVRAMHLNSWLHHPPTTDGTPGKAYVLGGHAWVIVESSGRARIGMGETFAPLSGRFGSVELPSFGDDMLQGNRCVRIATADQLVHRLWAPLSGRVVETNDRAFTEVETSDFGTTCKSWLITMIPNNLGLELPRLTRR